MSQIVPNLVYPEYIQKAYEMRANEEPKEVVPDYEQKWVSTRCSVDQQLVYTRRLPTGERVYSTTFDDADGMNRKQRRQLTSTMRKKKISF